MVSLITGGSGRLGRELRRVFPDALHPTRGELDITDPTAVYNFMRESAPEMIIHAAALTGIRECEENKELAYRTNVEGTANLVRAIAALDLDCYFVYISTACVFYGDRGNYTEDDIPYPKNFYSLTKLLGELVLKCSKLDKQLIIRTNFVAREKWPHPKAFMDRYGTYLFADDLALATRVVLSGKPTGVLHVCGDQKMSMFELAKITTPEIRPTTLAEYQGPPLTVDMSLESIRMKPFKISRTVGQDSFPNLSDQFQNIWRTGKGPS